MSLGKPVITTLRGNSPRELQNHVDQLNQRLKAIEDALQLGNGVTLQSVIQSLMAQKDGTVVKAGGVLKTT